MVAFRPRCSRQTGGVVTKCGATIRLWNTDTGEEMKRFDIGETVNYSAVFADGKRIVTTGDDDRLRIWNYDAGCELLCIEPGGSVGNVWCSPDGREVAADIDSKVVQVWDACTGTPLRYAKSIHEVRMSWAGHRASHWHTLIDAHWGTTITSTSTGTTIAWYPVDLTKVRENQIGGIVVGASGSVIHLLHLEGALSFP